MADKITSVYIISGSDSDNRNTSYMYYIPSFRQKGGKKESKITNQEGLTKALLIAISAIVHKVEDGFRSIFIIYTDDPTLIEQLNDQKHHREYNTKICRKNIDTFWDCVAFLYQNECFVAVQMASQADKGYNELFDMYLEAFY